MVVFPDPEPPAMPIIRGVARDDILELYWNGIEFGIK
jgi:hypothetical protein